MKKLRLNMFLIREDFSLDSPDPLLDEKNKSLRFRGTKSTNTLIVVFVFVVDIFEGITKPSI